MSPQDNSASPTPVVVFSPELWFGVWSSRHRIAVGLGDRGWPVIYSSGPLLTWQRGTDLWAKAGRMGDVVREGNILVDVPGRGEAMWERSAAWRRWAIGRHARRLRRTALAAGGANGPLTAFLFHPKYWPNAQALKPDRVVYFSYDALSLSPGWDDLQARWEAELVERADLIVAYSRQMLDYMPERARQIGHELPTGVDYDLFVGAADLPCPADLASVPSPRVGYTGHINQKLDLATMVEVAGSRPQLNFVFVGPAGPGNGGSFQGHPEETAAWHRLAALPNVYHLGPKPFSDVPAYMAHMDVNIMCYRLEGGWWQAGYPLKMHEYLATGKPVVGTGLQTILPFGDVIDIVSDVDEWGAALDRAVASGGVGSVDARRAVARANSWDVRLDNLDRWMREAVAAPRT